MFLISKYDMQIQWSANTFAKELSRCLGEFDDAIKNSDKATQDAVLKNADDTLEHKFFVLGSMGDNLNPLVWNKDIKTGFEWPNGRFYLDYKIVDPNNTADVKVPWELSRCHHLLWLGEAYVLTSDEKYARELVLQISDWIDKNKFMYSINWTCAMDVAIRAVNWMYGIYMIRNSSAFSDAFAAKALISLYQHGHFIYTNLEKNIPYSHNHYDADLAGLVYLGLLFKGTKRGKKWLDFSSSELFQEIRLQVLPSGVHFERSVSYHRLVTELFSFPYYALFRNKLFIPKDIKSRLVSMHAYIKSYTPSGGLAPTVEDNDDGRFLPFVPHELRNHSYLTDPDSMENRIVSNGCPLLPKLGLEVVTSILYDDAGFAVLRKADAFVFVCNGGQGKYETSNKRVGSHTHNDLLSFVFSLGEDDIIVDPGTYVYTADCMQRNLFRSTRKHNTIMVDEEEQNILPAKDMFVIEKNAAIDEMHLQKTENVIKLDGSYSTLQGRMNHSRSFLLTDNQMVVCDVVKKEGLNHNIKQFFHLANTIKVVKSEGGHIELETSQYKVEILFDSNLLSSVSVKEDFISPSYGVLVPAKTIEAEACFDDQMELTTTIKWYKR